MNIIIGAKALYSFSLLVIFLFYFGLPSLRKFQAKEVLINKRAISLDQATPAITFCALSNDAETTGWKSVDENDASVENISWTSTDDFKEHLKVSSFYDGCIQANLLECILSSTYNLSETIMEAYVQHHPAADLDILNSSYWINDISLTDMGNCHTLNNSVTLADSKWAFSLDPNLYYKVLVHDPNFFMITTNPATIPFISLNLVADEGIQFMYIEAIQHINMDRPNQPCESNIILK